jgi:tRNA wybutosine-synthesizing protein 3
MPPPPPALPTSFTSRKALILSQLSIPAEQYDDLSPKGSIDEGIRDLIEGINAREGWVTTSSCAGRASVFVEGEKARRRKGTPLVKDKAEEAARDVDEGGGPKEGGGGEEDAFAVGEGEDGKVDEYGHVEDDRDADEIERQGRKLKPAGAGGKGGGGRWLFVSHEAMDMHWLDGKDFSTFLGMRRVGEVAESGRQFTDERLIHFKFEPMVRGPFSLCIFKFLSFSGSLGIPTIRFRGYLHLSCLFLLKSLLKILANISQILHVLTASLSHAQTILKAALQAGFRESGAINLTSAISEAPTPMVAVRSAGLALDSVIGWLNADDDCICIVSETYLKGLLAVANERFDENLKRITRFRDLLLASAQTPADIEARKKSKGNDWEDASIRWERKRAEGLKRSQELKERLNSDST